MMMQAHADLKTLNTFGISAHTPVLVMIGNANELNELAAMPGFESKDWRILGGGSNVLLTQDVGKPVVRIAIPGMKVLDTQGTEVIVEAGAGIIWHKFVQWTLNKGLFGLENLSLIPGTVGASPIQNIGAYGVELVDVFHSLDAWDIRTGLIRTFATDDCAFGYRDSVFKHEAKDRFVITAVRFRLRTVPDLKLDYGTIRAELEAMKITSPTAQDVSDAVVAIRRSKLPDPAQIGNAGSFFKNPTIPASQYESLKTAHADIPGYPASEGVKVPAGWLIEQAGWKGFREGDAGVHAKQALVLVNHGAASGDQIVSLAKRIQDDVAGKFGIHIHPEVNIW
jgi:UDP-N-acetylmuramate dehydrogenase